jgi:signal peptidase I
MATFRRVFKDVVLPIAVAVALALVIQAAIAKPYEIPTGSMVPTIEPHDRIIANRLIYRVRDIRRGDIVVFTPTSSARATCGPEVVGDVPFVKRVIGLPGDVVKVSGGVTTVNGTPFTVKDGREPQYEMTWPAVPPDHMLVLGDNRNESCDAHLWQPDPFVPESAVIGEAEVTYWPLARVGFLD